MRKAKLGSTAALVLIPAVLTGSAFAQEQPSTTWTVFAENLHTSVGSTIKNAIVQVEGGKIRAILPGRSMTRDSVRAVHVTAGMIDASVRITVGQEAVEQTLEVSPTFSVADAFDPFDPRWKRQARAGVTTAFVAPPERNVIGGLGVALKTAGPPSLEGRMLVGTGVLCGVIGDSPSSGNSPAFGRPTSFYNRRPTTRMGVEWEWRKSFFDAALAPEFPEVEFEGADVLRAVLAGNIKLQIQAWTTADIRTAIFLKEEMAREGFGDMRLILDSAAEAWKEPAMLVRSGAEVVLPPYAIEGRTGDGSMMAWKVAKDLVDRGVLVALSAHGSTNERTRLAVQAGYAMRGGLTFDEALAAVTSAPARILGVQDRVGSVEVGKDADLVLWNGKPFEISSRVVGVLAGGELVLDPRNDG